MVSPIRVAGRAGENLTRAARRLFARAALPGDAGAWLLVRLAAPLDEPAPPRLPFAPEASLSLLELLGTLEQAASDPQIDGVLLRFAGAPLGFAQALSLRRAVEAVRAAGKPVAVWAERLDAQDYLVATAATRIWLAPVGELFLVGLRMGGFYLRGLLDHLGVKPEVVRIGSHKAAAEHLTREGMSPEEREQLGALIDDLFEELIARIAAGRGLEPGAVRALIDRGPFRAAAAAEAGLSDGCLYPDELPAALDALTRPIGPGPGARASWRPRSTTRCAAPTPAGVRSSGACPGSPTWPCAVRSSAEAGRAASTATRCASCSTRSAATAACAASCCASTARAATASPRICSGAPSASWPGRSRWSRRWETWRPRAATTWRRRRTRSSRRRAP
jgi:hypothetical protein